MSGVKQSVVITGAYGGMGKAVAKLLSANGFRVFALDRTVADGEDDIVPIRVDLTDEKDVAKAFETVCKMTPELYAVIHFAGIYMLDSLIEMETEAFERIFQINLGAAFLVNKTFLPLLKEGGRIIMTTSELATLDPLPFTGIYAVTKGALDQYAYSLRMELQLKGIEVSVLRAGAVKTGMLGISTDALDHFCEKTTLYSCNAKRFKRIVESVEARSIEPSVLAKKIFCILKKTHPAFSYSINRNPLLLMLDFLPKGLRFRIIKWILT